MNLRSRFSKMQVERQFSADRINVLVNDPRIRPWVAPGDNTLDLAPQVENPGNVLLMGEYGGVMFLRMMPGIYEAHTVVAPIARGSWTNELTAAAVEWMFLRTDCFEIVTRVPHGHIAAKAAAENRGLRYEFTRPAECLFMGEMRDVHIHSMRIQDWLPRAIHLIAAGRDFHENLHVGAALLGVTESAHADDPNHNLYVGAAISMVRNGQLHKGVAWYNRWALVSRHEPVAVLDINPVTLKIDHGLAVRLGPDDNVEVFRHVPVVTH